MFESYQRNRFLVKVGNEWLSSAKMDDKNLHPHVDAVIMPGADTVWLGRGHTINAPSLASYAQGSSVLEVWLPSGKSARQILVNYSAVEYRPLTMSQDAGPAMEYAVLKGCSFEQYDYSIDQAPAEVQNFK